MQQTWTPLESLDFANPAILHYHIETTYWTGLQHDFKIVIPDYPTFKKYPEKFFFSQREVQEILLRWFVNTGARKLPIPLQLAGSDYRLKHLNYIRVYRVEEGFIICNDKNKALNKELTAAPLVPPQPLAAKPLLLL